MRFLSSTHQAASLLLTTYYLLLTTYYLLLTTTTHQAASFERQGGPPAFERYLRQPHKQALTDWREYRTVGRPIVIERTNHPWEVRACSNE
jgi:hypothetical protein